MPAVPYNPVPTVSPGSTPIPYRTDRGVSETAFGANIGGAISRLGSQIGQSANVIEQDVLARQKLNDEAAVNAATTSDILSSGDLNNKFRQLQGSQAQDGLEAHVAALKEARENIRNSLTSDAQRKLFDSQTMHRFALDVVNSSQYAGTQMRQYTKQTNASAQDALIQHAISNWRTPGVIDRDFQQMAELETKAAGMDGVTEGDQLSERIRNKMTSAFMSLMPAIAKNDPDAAQKFFDKVKDKLDQSKVPTIQNSIDDRGIQYHAVTEANRITSSMLGAHSADRVHAAIIQQESGGRENVATSVTGARGIGQIQPATFAQYARPGEDINNPKDNFNVSRRIVEDLYNKYNGDPARIAVGYFSGPGNVAPMGSETPWKVDKHDPNMKYVSSYVADVTRRVQKGAGDVQAFGRDPETSLADLHKEAEATADRLYPAKEDTYLHDKFLTQLINNINNKASVEYKGLKDRQAGLTLWVGNQLNQNVPGTQRKPINIQEANTIDPSFGDHLDQLMKLNPNYQKALDAKFKANASEDFVIPEKQYYDIKHWFDGMSSEDQAKFNADEAFNARKINGKLRNYIQDTQSDLQHKAADTTGARSIMYNNQDAIMTAFKGMGYSGDEIKHMRSWLQGALMNRIRETHKDAPVKEEEGKRIVGELIAQAPHKDNWRDYLPFIGAFIPGGESDQLQFQKDYPEWVAKYTGARKKESTGEWFVPAGEGKWRRITPPAAAGG